MIPLSEFAQNVYSQNGEDGLLREILARLGAPLSNERWCVEVGAWDGVHLSNTCALIREMGFSAVLIEGDARKARQLSENHPQESVHKIQAWVDLEGESCLDSLLASTPIPLEFDVLSIDIDGCDYYVFQSLRKYLPRVVVIEYNPTIPNEVFFVQEPNFSIQQGASASALVRLAKDKGYIPVCATGTNLLFVRVDLAETVVGEGATPDLATIRDDSAQRVFAFSGYDGRVFFSGPMPLPWHGIADCSNAAQPLPLFFRRFPGEWRGAKRTIWLAFRRWKFRRNLA